MNAIAYYLENILMPTLRKYGVSDSFIKYTIEIADLQINSLLRHWDDLSFRKTMLLLGSEEGPFYGPAAKFDTKCFVVVTIRNSPIEIIQSDGFQSAGLPDAISDSEVKAITGDAIRYFNTKDFFTLCQKAKNSSKPDLYQDIIAKYPVAWSALQHLATTSAKVVDYEKVHFDHPYQFEADIQSVTNSAIENVAKKAVKVKSIFDGYSLEMDPQLLELLHTITENIGGALVVDSFKSATRNFENLLRIIEFLLTRNSIFTTSNYYLENGHVERRIKPLQAAHTFSQMEHNMSQLSGLGRRHAATLKHFRNGE